MGPPPNNCTHHIAFSMLAGATNGAAEDTTRSFRRWRSCAFIPPESESHLEHAHSLLRAAGLNSPDDLRDHPGLPRQPLLCHEGAGPGLPDDDIDPLLVAAVLGLCNTGFYSSARPVIWTEKRLARRVVLYAVEGFYED